MLFPFFLLTTHPVFHLALSHSDLSPVHKEFLQTSLDSGEMYCRPGLM